MRLYFNYISLFILFTVCISFNVQAQDFNRITLNFERKSLPKVLKEIEKVGKKSIVFSYTEAEKYVISAQIVNKTQSEAIELVLRETPLTVIERERYFVVRNKAGNSNRKEITGRVIDENNNPLPYTNITLLNATDTTFVNGCVTNSDGEFFLAGEDGHKYLIRAYMLGYKTKILPVNERNIIELTPNVQQLKEISVVGTSVIDNGDKFLIIPSSLEKERSAHALSLLGELQLKMPGLFVDELMKKATVNGGTPIFMINGKERPFSRIMALNPNDILRIEYNNSVDVKYADRGAVGMINFIMKQVNDGGAILARVNGAVTTFRNNAQANASYYYGKSEWNFNYDNTWRKSKKQYENIHEEYIGKTDTIMRDHIAFPSKTDDLSHDFTLDYTYMYNPMTMFVATLGLRYHTNDRDEKYNIIERESENRQEYLKQYNYDYITTNPSLDLYFKKQWKNKSTLELNVVGTKSSGDYNRSVGYSTDYNQASVTGNDSWRLGGEIFYSRAWKHVSMKMGLKYSHNDAESDYEENEERVVNSKITQDNIYFYGGLSGSVKKLWYSFSMAGNYVRSENMTKSEDFIKPYSSVSLNYRFSKNLSAGYSCSYSQSIPSTLYVSDVVQTVDDISVQVGNMELKPSNHISNGLFVRYNIGNFYSSLQGNFDRTNKVLYNDVSYISDLSSPYNGKFLKTMKNGNSLNRVNLRLSLGIQRLFNHFTIQSFLGWNQYVLKGDEKRLFKKSKLYRAIALNYYVDNLKVYATYSCGNSGFNGMDYYYYGSYGYLGIDYKWKNWVLGCMYSYPFSSHGMRQVTEKYSDVNPYKKEFYIKDFANMFSLTVQYRVNFNELFKKSNRSLRNKGVETGVNLNY